MLQLYELKDKVRLSKTECKIFHFQFRFVFKNAIYIFALIPVIYKLKFKDSDVIWTLPSKAGLVRNFQILQIYDVEKLAFINSNFLVNI